EKQLLQDPADLHALMMLAQLYRVSKRFAEFPYPYTDFTKAIAYYNRLFTLTGNTEFLNSLASIYYYDLKDYAEALKTLRRREEKALLYDGDLLQLAQIESHFGRYEQALQTLLRSEHRFLAEEAALRIITGDFTDISTKTGNYKETRWRQTLQRLAENKELQKSEHLRLIRQLPAPDAIKYLEQQQPSPQVELLYLSLLAVEPAAEVPVQEYVRGELANKFAADPEFLGTASILFGE
ncbi:MAG: tetratricopeptide repeat protein, partial [Dethiobacteraceae bacterium]